MANVVLIIVILIVAALLTALIGLAFLILEDYLSKTKGKPVVPEGSCLQVLAGVIFIFVLIAFTLYQLPQPRRIVYDTFSTPTYTLTPTLTPTIPLTVILEAALTKTSTFTPESTHTAAANVPPTPTPSVPPSITPTPQPTPTLTPTPSPSASTLFEDDFDNNLNAWELNTDTDVVQTIDDKLFINLDTEQDEILAWTTLDRSFSDFILEVDALYESEVDRHEYGVLVRKQDDKNFYQFALVNDNFNAWKYEEGEWQQLRENTPALSINSTGQINHLKLTVVGDRFQFFVNDKLLADLVDDSLAQGDIGLLAAIYEPGQAQVSFDNLILSPGDNEAFSDETPEPQPTPSPSNEDYKLVYTKWDGIYHNIYVADTNGTSEQFILSRGAGPSWTPDGTSIFFYGEPGIERQIRDGIEHIIERVGDGIVIMGASPLPANVEQLKLFQPSKWNLGSARWANVSPDGKMVAFDARPGGDFRIYFFDIAGTEQLPFEIVGEQADWSPDGQKLVYRSGRNNQIGIWTSNRDDSGHTLITNTGTDSFPAWSPDGGTIAFAREVDGNWDIYTVNIDGTNVQRLTDDPRHDILPVYTPGGDIVFRSARTGSWGIWKMRGDGANQEEIIPKADIGPDWAYSKMDVN